MDSRLKVTKKVLKETDGILEFCFEIENTSEEEVWLKELELYHGDSLKELGVTEENCLFFRSGRHKNDMPSVAVFGRFDDCMKDAIGAINRFAADKAERYGSRNAGNPSVFCTWYYYGLTVSYEDVITNLNRMKQLKLPFDVFHIDEGWEKTFGEWEPNEKFPVPMKEVAEQIKEAGYRPGIWTSPFVTSI